MKNYTVSKTLLVSLLVSTALLVGCSDSTKSEGSKDGGKVSVENLVHTPETLQKEIEDLEAAVADLSTPNHREITLQLIDYYQSYADMFKNTKMAPEMLFRAGNQAVNLEEFELSLQLYGRVEQYYRDYLKRPEAIFLEAFVFETYLNEFGKAKVKYEKLIKQYPEHELAMQSKESLKYLGMSDADRIKQFEKNNQ